MASSSVSRSRKRPAAVSSSSSPPPPPPPPQVPSCLRTLRLTPKKQFPQIERTCDVIQHYIKFYGKTARLTSPEGRQRDYFEVEFFFQEEARDALKNCKIPHMTIEWAQGNISDNRLTGPAKVSYDPRVMIRCDHDDFSTLPSVPQPRNNPFPIKWVLPKSPKRTQGQPKLPPEPAVRYRPKKVQIVPADPRKPHKTRYWPKFPVYPPIK